MKSRCKAGGKVNDLFGKVGCPSVGVGVKLKGRGLERAESLPSGVWGWAPNSLKYICANAILGIFLRLCERLKFKSMQYNTCTFSGDYNSERIFKIGQYVTKLCVEHLGFTFFGSPCITGVWGRAELLVGTGLPLTFYSWAYVRPWCWIWTYVTPWQLNRT